MSEEGVLQGGQAAPSGRQAVRSRRELLLLLIAAVALQAIVWAALIPLFSAHVGYGLHDLSDVPHYLSTADRMARGDWPYIDFGFEYPPLALPLFFLPRSDGTLAAYEFWFAVEMIATCAASGVVVALIAVKIWGGLGRPFAAAVSLLSGARRVRRSESQSVRPRGGTHDRALRPGACT